jgi:hypothetical protein
VRTLKKVSSKAPALEVCLSHPPLAVKAEILPGESEVKAKMARKLRSRAWQDGAKKALTLPASFA